MMIDNLVKERKYNNISKEDLEKVLIKAGVFRAWEPERPNDISRIVTCEALGQIFQIEWWINQCYLRIGHMQMMFHWVRVDTTWPWWEYKRELHFENSLRRPFESSDLVAVLGIEYSESYLQKNPEKKIYKVKENGIGKEVQGI